MTHKSFKGKAIDMERLRQENAKTPALGNMGVNAAGDVIRSDGSVVESSSQRTRKHYDKPAQTASVSLKGEVVTERDIDALTKPSTPKKPKSSKKMVEVVQDNGDIVMQPEADSDEA